MVLIQTPPSSFETQLHEPTRAIEHLLPGLCIDFCKKRKIKNGNNAYACDYPSRRQNLLLSFFLSFFIFVHFFFSPVVPRLLERSSSVLSFSYLRLLSPLLRFVCRSLQSLFDLFRPLSLFFFIRPSCSLPGTFPRAESMLRALNFFFPSLSSTLCL